MIGKSSSTISSLSQFIISSFVICLGDIRPVSDTLTLNWYKSVKPRIHSISPIPDTKYYVISIKTSIITQRMMKSYKAKQCTNVRVTGCHLTQKQWILHPSLILYVQNIQILWGLSSNSIVLSGLSGFWWLWNLRVKILGSDWIFLPLKNVPRILILIQHF